MAKYLLDTDWAIYYLRGKEAFVKAIDEYRKEGIAISIISIAELYEGVYRSRRPEEKEMVLIDFLEGFKSWDYQASSPPFWEEACTAEGNGVYG